MTLKTILITTAFAMLANPTLAHHCDTKVDKEKLLASLKGEWAGTSGDDGGYTMLHLKVNKNGTFARNGSYMQYVSPRNTFKDEGLERRNIKGRFTVNNDCSLKFNPGHSWTGEELASGRKIDFNKFLVSTDNNTISGVRSENPRTDYWRNNFGFTLHRIE